MNVVNRGQMAEWMVREQKRANALMALMKTFHAHGPFVVGAGDEAASVLGCEAGDRVEYVDEGSIIVRRKGA